MEEQQNFLYEYTKFCLEQTQHGVDTVGTKLTGVMEISALLLLGLRVTVWLPESFRLPSVRKHSAPL